MKDRSCGNCTFHRHKVVQDKRGYTTGNMCTCKESALYKEFVDSTYVCPCFKEKRRRKLWQ